MTRKTTFWLQWLSQLFFLIVFVLALSTGRMPIWLALFLGSFSLAFFFGRFYCGWMCPIRTLQRPISLAKRKLGFKEKIGPNFIRKPISRYLALGFFFTVLTWTMVSRQPLPVLPILLALGVLVATFLPESVWHRWLCPYGTLLSLPGHFSRRSLSVQSERCTGCTACAKVCPAEAITAGNRVTAKGRPTYEMEPSHCLLCHECDRVCSVDAIAYESMGQDAKEEK